MIAEAPASYRGVTDHRAEAIAKELQRLGCKTVLDFGSHNGHIALKLGVEGFQVTAIDAEHVATGPNVRGIKRRIEDPGELAKLGKFDAVLALSVLHHLEHWPEMFKALRHIARRIVLVEAPHPEETLRSARHKGSLREIYEAVGSVSCGEVVRTPAVHQKHLLRVTHAAPPLLTGTVFDGGGFHARSQRMFGHLFVKPLGYLPYPGSLNLRLDRVADMGPEQIRLRPDAKRDYRMWRGRLPRWPDVSCHIMDVGKRGHGPECVELLAPVKLRDLGINSGDAVEVEVVWP